MLKKLLVSALILGASLSLEAQQKDIEVVYLRNGSILKGKILEHALGKSLKLETSDGSIFVLQENEIERITRNGANTSESQSSVPYTKRAREEKASQIGFGLSFTSTGDSDGSPFYRITLPSLDYLISRRWGISAKLDYSRPSVGGDYASLLTFHVGPLISWRTSENGRLELRPMLGYTWVNINSSSTNLWGHDYYIKERGGVVTTEISLQYRHHISSKLDLIGGVGLTNVGGGFNIGAGIGYRF
ncbi:MAG: hypothetical protein SOW66_03465 [Porphyromonas sp.]|nr:hypothetical protein [Porphyromonas sp.]